MGLRGLGFRGPIIPKPDTPHCPVNPFSPLNPKLLSTRNPNPSLLGERQESQLGLCLKVPIPMQKPEI